MGWTDYNGVQIADNPTGQGGVNLNGNFQFLADAVLASAMQARLTLTSGTPVPTTGVSNQTTLYLTPYQGNKIGLYDTDHWSLHELTSEISIANSGFTVNKNHDIFVYDNAGTLALDKAVWTDDTSRATSLALQDGVYVKSGDTGRRYVGTIRTVDDSGTAKFEMSFGGSGTRGRLFVWNNTNRVEMQATTTEPTDSWNYTLGTWRLSNNNVENRIEVVVGLAEDSVNVNAYSISSNSIVSNRIVGIGENSTNSIATGCTTGLATVTSNVTHSSMLRTVPRTGFSQFNWLETANPVGTAVWIGDGGVPLLFQTGISLVGRF